MVPAVLVGGVARRAARRTSTITKARTALGSREIVVQIPAVSSYAADRAARLRRLVGGAIYTGTSKHFVKYRDDRSPYGYDAVDIGAMPRGDRLHGPRRRVRAGLRPRGRPAVRSACCSGCRSASCPAATSSTPRIAASSSSRSRAASPTASSATCGATASRRRPACSRRGSTSAFDDQARDRGYMLIRVRALPERILAAVPRHARHRRVPARRRERRGRRRLRAPDRSRVVRVGVPARDVPRVLARRSRRRAARAARAVATSRDLTRVDLELDRPTRSGAARRRRRPTRSASSSSSRRRWARRAAWSRR